MTICKNCFSLSHSKIQSTERAFINNKIFFFALSFSIVLACAISADVTTNIFDYATTDSARAAWVAGQYSKTVGIYSDGAGEEKNGVLFPCVFTNSSDRNYWDMTTSLSFSSESNFSLHIYVSNPAVISNFTLYFKSPGGYYGAWLTNLKIGWQTLRISKSSFTTEGSPSGWGNITGVRISPWKNGNGTTDIIINDLSAYSPKIMIVKGTRNPDTEVVSTAVSFIVSCLDAYSIEYNIIGDEDVDSGSLIGSKLAIFPYNSDLTDTELTKIEEYSQGGGKIIFFYLLPNRIASILKITNVSWIQIQLSAMKFIDGLVSCMPESVNQASWNITVVKPSSPVTSVLAYWMNANGVQTTYPAWILNTNGAFMSHILINDDLVMKQRLMFSIVAHFMPEVFEQAAEGAIKNIGVINSYYTYNEAYSSIKADAALTPRYNTVSLFLNQTEQARQKAIESFGSGNYCECINFCEEAQNSIFEAYYRAQRSVLPEVRAVWNHSGTGAYPGNWIKSAENLYNNGFNAVFPNMLWGGVAHYNSAYLPLSETYQQYGDQITACVSACHAKGIEVHVWKVNWNLLNAPQTFIDSMRAQNRTQIDYNGNPVDWLCPSVDANYELELNSMLEVVSNYDVDGIHFDYIRYPDNNSCFCDNCRKKFEADRGVTVANWPLDCYSGSMHTIYYNWRCENITRLVKGVYEQAKAIKPAIKISAAIWPDYSSCKEYIGQDWLLWVKNGYLDFVCPMDYTLTLEDFKYYVDMQIGQINEAMPMFPGVGAWQITTDHTIPQLRYTRDTNRGGFIIFNYDSNLAERILPALSKGFTARDTKGNTFSLY